MDVFAVIQGYETFRANTDGQLKDIDCIGIYSSLEFAMLATGCDVTSFVETSAYSDSLCIDTTWQAKSRKGGANYQIITLSKKGLIPMLRI